MKGKTAYNFWLAKPVDSVMNANPPLLLFLHGRSLSGSDLNLVRKYGVIHELDKGRSIPAIVVAPQVPAGKPWEPKKIKEVLDYVRNNYAYDTNRVYVVGMSLGAYGTLHFTGEYPSVVTAAVALCGGGDPSDACQLAGVPLWIQHGNRDNAVPLSESQKIVNAIRNCNGGDKLKFTVVPGADHGDLERVFRTDEMYDWLFQFNKTIEQLTEKN